MRYLRLTLLILINITPVLSFAQELTPNIHVDTNGQIYVKANSPIYFFVSPADNINNKELIPSSDTLANPMYFDGSGKHYFVYNNKGESVRYLILADAVGPKPSIKIEKGLLFSRNCRLYADINATLSINAKDDYSGVKSVFFSIDGSPFSQYNEPITFDRQGEPEIKIYAIDNVGNRSDTSAYKVIIAPEALFKVDNIYFETASAYLLPESSSSLEGMLQIMTEFPELLVEISAHADARGSSESNMNLSQRRAQAVVAYLAAKGIDARRLKTKGLGDSQIINDCTKGVPCPDIKHKQNRRVEFRFSLPK